MVEHAPVTHAIFGRMQDSPDCACAPSFSVHAGVQRRAVEVLHLERVLRPAPSRRHPLAGLWKADYGPGGVQIVLISYDFTGPAARIVAVKVAPGSQVSCAHATSFSDPGAP